MATVASVKPAVAFSKAYFPMTGLERQTSGGWQPRGMTSLDLGDQPTVTQRITHERRRTIIRSYARTGTGIAALNITDTNTVLLWRARSLASRRISVRLNGTGERTTTQVRIQVQQRQFPSPF